MNSNQLLKFRQFNFVPGEFHLPLVAVNIFSENSSAVSAEQMKPMDDLIYDLWMMFTSLACRGE